MQRFNSAALLQVFWDSQYDEISDERFLSFLDKKYIVGVVIILPCRVPVYAIYNRITAKMA